MTRWLLMTLLIAACGGDGTGSNPTPKRYVLYVQGDQTGTPYPYCVASVSSPAFLTVHSHAAVTDSSVAELTVKPGRYKLSWLVDFYDSNGFLANTVSSSPNDSTNVPGSILFIC
jgi:hypothetical protein